MGQCKHSLRCLLPANNKCALPLKHSHCHADLQAQRILVGLEPNDLLPHLHGTSFCAVHFALGALQDQEVALLSVRLLLRGKCIVAVTSVGVSPLSLPA